MRRTALSIAAAAIAAIGGTTRTLHATLPECQPNPIYTCDGNPYNGTFNCEGYGQGDLNAACQAVNPDPENCTIDAAYCEWFEGCASENGGGLGESIYCEYEYTGGN